MKESITIVILFIIKLNFKILSKVIVTLYVITSLFRRLDSITTVGKYRKVSFCDTLPQSPKKVTTKKTLFKTTIVE